MSIRLLLALLIGVAIKTTVFVPWLHAADVPPTQFDTVDGRSPAPFAHSETQTLKLGPYTFTVGVPENTVLELLTPELERPRMLHFYHDRLLIGSRSGNVYWLDPPYDNPQVLIQLDDYPHSVVVHEDHLYIARTSRVDKVPYSLETKSVSSSELIPVVDVPGGRGHNSRTLKVGPDRRLYLSLGITGNCSNEFLDASYPEELRRGGLAVIDETRSPAVLRAYSSGLRNPVGFDWHPETGVMFASNNGPDHLGFELPPESFARVVEGSFHGMPWFYFDGKKLNRDSCISADAPMNITQVKKPAAVFAARSAPMDVLFLSKQFGRGSEPGDALVALRGGWGTSDGGGGGDPASRREPKLLHLRFTEGMPRQVTDYVTGFQLDAGERWARPVGLAEGPDGALYFTSDEGIQGLYRLRSATE
ncbi:MAG: PQQ-dependent sugar dehydrogenase [Granulosicoccus sp.]|nr:PQQ-dependent sugar dehydrogenase [Granulosicoccus sp.]